MVDKFAELISFLENNLIQGIFISVLLFIIVKRSLKNRIETYLSAQIIRWLIILYSFGAIFSRLLLLFFEHPQNYAFLNRVTGLYWWAYLLMLISNTILPLILLNNKIGKKINLLFIIALLMNLGWLFESFVIHVTTLHRDDIIKNPNPYLPNIRESRILMNGFFIGIFVLVIGNGIKIWTTKRNKPTE